MESPKSWKEIFVGVAILVIAGSIGWAANDFIVVHEKIANIPDPNIIVTTQTIEERFRVIDEKIDRNFDANTKRLDQIEAKIDSILFNLAFHGKPDKKSDKTVLSKFNDQEKDVVRIVPTLAKTPSQK